MGAEVGDEIVLVNPSEVVTIMKQVPKGRLITIIEVCRARVLGIRPRGDSNPYLQYIEIGLFPVYISAVPVVGSKVKLPIRLVPELTERHRTQSLRQLASEYGVSHETVRRTIARARNSPLDKRLSKT
jgi:hypothetical protein